jgi:putative ABC transport system substrate-binding protein
MTPARTPLRSSRGRPAPVADNPADRFAVGHGGLPRRAVVLGLGGAFIVRAVAWPSTASAQPAERVFRIGLLAPTAGPVPETDALFDALSKLGYREGRNLVVERRFAAGDDDRLRTLATDLVRMGVDVIVTQSTTATQAAKSVTTTIPIVMGSSADAIGTGLVPSLSHPGGNVTGISFLGNEWTVKHVQLMLELRPGASRLAYLANYLFLPEPQMYRNMETAAVAAGANMHLYDVRSDLDYERAFASMRNERADALAVASNVVHRERRYQLVGLAARYGLPAVYGSRDMVEAGGLISYGVDFRDLWSTTANYVARILRGVRPADLPIEQPTKFELVINLKTAKALGLTVPPALLARADEVIE